MLRTRIIASTAATVIVGAVFAVAMTFVNRAETFVAPLRVEPSERAPVTLRIPWTRVVLDTADGELPSLTCEVRLEIAGVPGYADVRDPATRTIVIDLPRANEDLGLTVARALLTELAELSGGAYLPLRDVRRAANSVSERARGAP